MRGRILVVEDRENLRRLVETTLAEEGFQVDAASIPSGNGWRVSQINLNDGSVEGLSHRDLPVFSVQYHPEGSPGPQDNQYVFDRFLDLLRERKRQGEGVLV